MIRVRVGDEDPAYGHSHRIDDRIDVDIDSRTGVYNCDIPRSQYPRVGAGPGHHARVGSDEAPYSRREFLDGSWRQSHFITGFDWIGRLAPASLAC